jgi:hypothetical protein
VVTFPDNRVAIDGGVIAGKYHYHNLVDGMGARCPDNRQSSRGHCLSKGTTTMSLSVEPNGGSRRKLSHAHARFKGELFRSALPRALNPNRQSLVQGKRRRFLGAFGMEKIPSGVSRPANAA